MGKWALATPLYTSSSWILMISCRLFTSKAVITSLEHINSLHPSIGSWLLSKSDMIIFIYAFAWIFVLSSVIPSLILGKNNGVLIQFIVVLILSLIPILIQDSIITIFGGKTIDQILDVTFLFTNPAVAFGYLFLPYLIMIIIDVRKRLQSQQSSTEREVLNNET